MPNNKRIAKNTLFLYIRMILIMGVTLYTSRVILYKLGVEDYGLYNVVGGVVGMLAFLNGTLSVGTTRFLTYDLGVGDQERLKRTFSTAFYIHLALALFVVLILETAGMWFLYNKMVIAPSRLAACVWVLQMSILTTFFSICQVPYTATIMAHERMGIYAYVGIYEAFAKLGVCFLLSVAPIDRLVFYAILIALVQISVILFYSFYCSIHFKESHLSRVIDRNSLRGMLGFSGWNVMANLSDTLNHQGILVLINLFFTPALAAAQAIAGQVAGAMMQFVNNFRTAINPQIIKLYAAGERNASKKLTLETTVWCFDLVLLLGFPAIVVMDKLMHIWLVEVPDHAVVFTQWVILRRIIGTFSASFYTPIMAANKMHVNSITAVFTGIGEFILLYVLFKLGFGPMWIQYLGLLNAVIYSFVVKSYVLHKDIDYSLQELFTCYWICAKVALLSCGITLILIYPLNNTLTQTLIKGLVAITAVVFSSYVCMGCEMKQKLKAIVMNKIGQNR